MQEIMSISVRRRAFLAVFSKKNEEIMSISVRRQAVLSVFSNNKCMALRGAEDHHGTRWLLLRRRPRLDPFWFSGLGEREPLEPSRTKSSRICHSCKVSYWIACLL